VVAALHLPLEHFKDAERAAFFDRSNQLSVLRKKAEGATVTSRYYFTAITLWRGLGTSELSNMLGTQRESPSGIAGSELFLSSAGPFIER